MACVMAFNCFLKEFMLHFIRGFSQCQLIHYHGASRLVFSKHGRVPCLGLALQTFILNAKGNRCY